MREELVWQSQLTVDDVAELEQSDLEMLVNSLDDVVMSICQDFGLFQ